DVTGEPGTQHVWTEEAVGVRLLDGTLEDSLDVKKLASDVDVSDLGANGIARDRTTLNQQMGVPLHQQMVFERSRLALVGVARDVLGERRLLVDELPLHAGREPRATSPAQTGCLDDLDDPVGFHRKGFAETLVAFVTQIEVEREAILLVNVSCEEGIHLVLPFVHEITSAERRFPAGT